MDLKEFAETSPTAKNLVEIILKENNEAKRQDQIAKLNREELERLARLEQIQFHTKRCKDFLEEYDKHRQLAQDALEAAYRASGRLPADSGANPFSPHLLNVHMPPVVLPPFEPLYPNFTTMQCFIAAEMARGVGGGR